MHSIDGDDTNPGTGIDSPAHAPAAADPQLSAVVVPLLRGVLYREDDPALWTALLQLRARAMDYVAVLALELQVDEAEGYAFLRARPDDEEEDGAGKARLPRLVRRQPLGFQVSLLLALLRKKLAEFDASGGDTRLVLTRSQVLELVRVFLPSGSNESRLIDQVDTHLNKVADLGFVRRLKPAGAIGGLQIGANWQTGAWVLGVEAEEPRDLPGPLPGQHHVGLLADFHAQQGCAHGRAVLSADRWSSRTTATVASSRARPKSR